MTIAALVVIAASADSGALYLFGAILGGGGFGVAFLGSLRALEAQHLQRAVLDRAYEQELQLQRGTRPIVGQNVYVDEEASATIPALQDVPAVAPEQIARLQRFRAARDAGRVRRALSDLRRDAESGRNIMPVLIEAAESGATLGEMADEFRAVFGEWRPQS